MGGNGWEDIKIDTTFTEALKLAYWLTGQKKSEHRGNKLTWVLFSIHQMQKNKLMASKAIYELVEPEKPI